MTLQADLDALTSEAGVWDTTADTLKTAGTAVDGLTLDESAFSFITFTTDVGATYAQAQTHVSTILWAGHTEAGNIANALRTVRSEYESTDAHTQAHVKGIWVAE